MSEKLGTRNVLQNWKKLAKLILLISHSLTLDMLNNFCFHLYAEKSLFIGENCNVFFTSSAPPPSPVSLGVIELGPS